MTDEEVVEKWWDLHLADQYDDPAADPEMRAQIRARYTALVLSHHHRLVEQFRIRMIEEGRL